MGLISAALGSASGVLADQWKEYFYCEALPADVLVTKGQHRTSKRSTNYKGSDNIISNGSIIAVADGQCMLIVEQGKIVDLCAVPGEYKYDTSTEPSLFDGGKLGDNIKKVFGEVGKRFTFGGEAPKDQRIYYFNTKEILDNKFGTPTPFMFTVVNNKLGIDRTVSVRCSGIYSYRITNPMLFYTKVCGNVQSQYTRKEIDSTLKTEFISALQPAFAKLSELELRPAQIPAHQAELEEAMNAALEKKWAETRGITVQSIALNPISLTPEDLKKIQEMEDATAYGMNAAMMAGRMGNAQANAMEAAASNSAGAMNGFVGMNMAGNAGMGAGFAGFYNAAQQQTAAQQQAAAQQAQAAAPAADSWTCPSCNKPVTGKFCPECGTKKPEPKPAADSWTCPGCGKTVTGKFCPECGTKKPAVVPITGWTCSCGAVNKGKFCAECGAKKPAAAPLYKCDKCGWEPTDPLHPPKFCPECGDPFGDEDIINK